MNRRPRSAVPFFVSLVMAGLLLAPARAVAAVNATGGNMTTNGAYIIHTFTNSGTFAVTDGGNVEVLVVGGGGGGGSGANNSGSGGGGGGAGGLVYSNGFAVGISNITVTVGGGGAGSTTLSGNAANGSASSFLTLTAAGGGCGASGSGSQSAGSGGSGGGGSWTKSANGTGTANQGNNGGVCSGNRYAGGSGGGAGAAGGNNPAQYGAGVDGGAGVTNSISGSPVAYAGGGGSGVGGWWVSPGGAGGSGVGGAGGGSGGTSSSGQPGSSGAANRGGGGGGGCGDDSGPLPNGGNGGSGIVIVRYLSPVIANLAATNVTLTSACLNGNLISSNGVSTSVFVYWGTTDGGEVATAWGNTNQFADYQPLGPLTTNVTGLSSHTTYFYRYCATNAFGTNWASSSSVFITGEATVQATDPMGRATPTDTAIFTVYRPATCTNGDLIVNYTLSGTATNVTDYTIAPVSGAVVIASGQTNGTITVTPVFKVDVQKTVVLTLSAGPYTVGAANSATCTLASVIASGGTVTNIGAYMIHTFTNSGTFSVSAGMNVEVLVVAGGGGGGANGGGGGGAGGLIYSNAFPVIGGSNYTVTVGAGGPPHPNDVSNPTTGSNSVFGTLTAIGGGGGSSRDSGGQAASGGSGGGGGGADSTPRSLAGANNAPGQGNNGGNGAGSGGADNTGGGGGGAGGPGTAGSYRQAGNGGTGLQFTNFAAVAGSPAGWFAGGGAGGKVVNGNNGLGGTNGGGGNANVAGVANTGGGGGGAGSGGAGAAPGGSGIVIIRYILAPIINNLAATNVTLTSANLNGNFVFTGGGQASVFVYWGTNDGGTVAAAWGNTNQFADYQPLGSLTTNVIGLSSNTTYFYCYCATNATGTNWASPSSVFVPGAVTIAATSPNASEVGPVSGAFTVYRPATATNGDLAVNYTLGGSASNSVDYTTLSGVVTISNGQASATITVLPVWDQIVEGTETVQVTLAAGPYLIGSQSNDIVTIADAPVQRVWSGTGDWYAPSGWAGGILPSAGEGALISNGVVTLSNSTVHLAYLTLTNATLTFTNWSTALWADTVIIQTNGILNHMVCDTNASPSNTNRVYILCSNLTVNVGGLIDANGCGYLGGTNGLIGQGPGGGGFANTSGGGGGYGGTGGTSSHGSPGGGAYGSPSAPTQPGSGGAGGAFSTVRNGGNGGGAILIQSTNVTVNGTIRANGGTPGTPGKNGGGSGGGIDITCQTFVGGGNIQANGSSGSDNESGGAGGGRIAVVYDLAAQSALGTKPTVKFSAVAATGGNNNSQAGTLYLPTPVLLPDSLSTVLNGSIRIYGVTNWCPGSPVISNVVVKFEDSPFTLSATNDVLITASGGLELTNFTFSSGGSLLVTNSSTLTFRAAPTNTSGPIYGGLLAVTGSVTVATNCTVYLYSHTTNGGSVKFSVSNLFVNGALDANYKGYAGAKSTSLSGYGPGGGKSSGYPRGGGGGYGGNGGGANDGTQGGTNYGSASMPIQPGSGAGGGIAGAGGGLVWVESRDTIGINGSVLANGEPDGGDNSGGGSGGGIYLSSPTFKGTGTISAKGGGNGGGNSGGGGGGRIAMVGWTSDQFSGSLSVAPGTWYTSGQTGTIYRVQSAALSNTLYVQGYPASHTNASPYDYGSWPMDTMVVTDSIPQVAEQTATMRYFLTGWLATNGAGTVIASDVTTQAVFTVSTNTWLIWLWTNQYYLATASGANGGLLQDMTGWYTNGIKVSVTATAAQNYAFASWTGPGVPVGSNSVNPLVVTMDQARTIQASFYSTLPMPRSWNGTGVWLTATNWTPNGVPGPNDTLTVQSGQLTLTDPSQVDSMVISNGATLVFSNWVASLTVSAMTVLSNGTITCAVSDTNTLAGNSNRVNIICSNFTLNAFGSVDVSGKGFAGGINGKSGQGPGGGGYVGTSGGGGGYGGVGAASAHYSPGGIAYSSPSSPDLPGSGGGGGTFGSYYTGGNGGGAIRIQTTNLTLNGTIRANGGTPPIGGKNGGGSGGGVYFMCCTMVGNGSIQANGGSGMDNEGGGGGGGRIAVVYDVAAQSALGSQPTVTFSAVPGPSGMSGQQAGTVYLPSSVFLTDRIGDILTGSIRVYGVTNWGAVNAVVSNVIVKFEDSPFTLRVTNDMLMTTSAGLDLTNFTFSAGGNLLLTNNSTLTLRSGSTNGLATRYGGLLDVAGNITLATNCTNFVWSHPTNGSSVRIHGGNVLLAQGSQINANGTGYVKGYGDGRGGNANSGGGGGYGGAGGAGSHPGSTGGSPYGMSNEVPLRAGSPGGQGGAGLAGQGGGLVWLEVDGQMTLSGLITANGTTPSGYGGGGSGGGIYIRCNVLTNSVSGQLTANGAQGGIESGGGGGGRIYVWRKYQNGDLSFQGSATNGAFGGSSSQPGAVGTIFWDGLSFGVIYTIR